MRRDRVQDTRGMTLVELLVVVVVLGIVMGSVYSVYLTHQKVAYSSEEVVEVQQNLRIAMDSITRDLQMGGMMVPSSGTQTTALTSSYGNYTSAISYGGSTAITYGNYSTAISINTASAEGVYARITSAPALVSGTTYTVALESANAVDGFSVNDSVRIFRPSSLAQPLDGVFAVTAVNRGASTVTLSGIATNNFVLGDIIAKTTSDGRNPNMIEYYLVNGGATIDGFSCPATQRCLVRSANKVKEIIATNIASLRFHYLTNASPPEDTVPSDVSAVRAVRVTITGQTSDTAQLSGAKTRQMESVVKFRNRR
ncbi:PilW family protein [Geobacter pickeringii]|uniref:Pilus assembly protein PilW n=1 Tax=Geobacter pickeringii TaxID=345632 RepID=A0A0B5BCT6_9BACT|nr:prepilin-type N-terminal cleavage/methylation domain-containing protein [Geobacter pickeringii]AJE02894.1 hypothetical protein GPICK_05495 [Geobacter pickeringii]